MNGHRSDFKLYVNGKSNKMDNKLLYDHLVAHNVDYFEVQIVDKVFVKNQSSKDLHEALIIKEREWIWKLETVTPKGLNLDDGFYSQNKRSRK